MKAQPTCALENVWTKQKIVTEAEDTKDPASWRPPVGIGLCISRLHFLNACATTTETLSHILIKAQLSETNSRSQVEDDRKGALLSDNVFITLSN